MWISFLYSLSFPFFTLLPSIFYLCYPFYSFALLLFISSSFSESLFLSASSLPTSVSHFLSFYPIYLLHSPYFWIFFRFSLLVFFLLLLFFSYNYFKLLWYFIYFYLYSSMFYLSLFTYPFSSLFFLPFSMFLFSLSPTPNSLYLSLFLFSQFPTLLSIYISLLCYVI